VSRLGKTYTPRLNRGRGRSAARRRNRRPGDVPDFM